MNEWIAAKESMPEEDEKVEVLGSDGLIRQAIGANYNGYKGFVVHATDDFITGHMHYDITHWRTV